jgi:hypothetical protein
MADDDEKTEYKAHEHHPMLKPDTSHVLAH